MAKRLTCPHCRVIHDYDVPAREVLAPMRQVRCRGCGKSFNYGFVPEYTTERERTPLEHRSPSSRIDDAIEGSAARERLRQHVARYTEYHDRDRDLLLLQLLDASDHLANELGAIRRAVDVLCKRAAK